MNNLDELLQSMTFDFFGSGKHKIEMDALLATKDAVFLDVKSRKNGSRFRFDWNIILRCCGSRLLKSHEIRRSAFFAPLAPDRSS